MDRSEGELNLSATGLPRHEGENSASLESVETLKEKLEHLGKLLDREQQEIDSL